jgi:8-oxo-dGTP diphosphatase
LNCVGIVERFSKMLKPVSEDHDADAAVALLLKPMNQGFEVLFVERVENPTDPWSGQMALPGGKRDSKDKDLKQTVVRETVEETSINLLYGCRFLGVMETLGSTLRPEMKVLPFVILLEHEPSIKLNEELKGFVWVPLEELAQHKGTAKFNFGEFPAYIVRDCVIWGLTYRILERFCTKIRG